MKVTYKLNDVLFHMNFQCLSFFVAFLLGNMFYHLPSHRSVYHVASISTFTFLNHMPFLPTYCLWLLSFTLMHQW